MAEKEPRARGYFVQRNYYFEHHDADGNVTSTETEAEWRKRVEKEWRSIPGVKCLAMNFHDRDVLDDGNPKPLHVHGWFQFESAKTATAAMTATGTSSTQNTQPIKNKVRSARYLCHLAEDAMNKGKHIYDPSNVICVNCDYMKLIANTKRNKLVDSEQDPELFVAELGDKIQNGELTKADAKQAILDEYETRGKSLWRKYRSSFDDDVAEAIQHKADEYMLNGRHLTTIYMFGLGGVGKTNIAEAIAYWLAHDHRFHSTGVGDKDKTFDMLSSYHGEDVSVLNEIEGSVFNMRAFLNTFDPWHAPTVNSRNVDKPWLATTAIITFTDPLENWIRDLMTFTKGATKRYGLDAKDDPFGSGKPTAAQEENFDIDHWQVLRRFGFVIEIRNNGNISAAQVSVIDDETHAVVPLGKQKAYAFKDVKSRKSCRAAARKMLVDMGLLSE
ncbi:Rep family protein [Lactiplantibacillus plantarum]|uniref:Rep family protein n=1 Tax=Lactiplantibacillus plantarum TaxID=1590 RepID=UPI00218229B2|nr:Rep family protein [Lactiplantibacillus plantarum]MCS8621655.1 hypothetical protein [Lactiplantibacillus plantarum]